MERKIRLLAIDDDSPVRNMMHGFIDWESHGIELLTCLENGRCAIDFIKNTKPDIVLTDIKMPIMDGLQLAEWIHDNEPSIDVILVSAYSEFEYARKAISYGVKHYLLKPIDENEMFEKLNDIANSRINGYTDHDAPICGNNSNCKDTVIKIRDYIDKNYNADISLEMLSSMFYFSPNHINRLFIQYYGITVYEYIIRVRLKKVCNLLSCTNMRIYEISNYVGYLSEKHLIRMFKKRYGMTPLEFRKKNSSAH